MPDATPRSPAEAPRRTAPAWCWWLLAGWMVATGWALWSFTPLDPARLAICRSAGR